MPSLWDYFSAVAKKRWEEANAVPPIKTVTPLDDLSQRSGVEITDVNIALAQTFGSLIKPIHGRSTITAIGVLDYMTVRYYRAYLSQDHGSFIHLAVERSAPKKVLECRLYQPYHEILPEWASREAAEHELHLAPGSPINEGLTWACWLLDNADPAIGGLIGCPTIPGKDADGGLQYARLFSQSPARVPPWQCYEEIVDAGGNAVRLRHEMMPYGRVLEDNKTTEYLIVSAVQQPGQQTVNYWLGIELSTTDLSIFPGR